MKSPFSSLALGAALAVAACAPSSPSTPAPEARKPMDLVGTEWLLEDNGGRGVLDNVEATLTFLPDGRVAGRGSCNRFTGSVTMEGATLSFKPLATTMMACPPAVMEQERTYLAALQAAERYEVSGSGPWLYIHGAGATKPLKFIRTRSEP
jgi:heat shock protein HslJ